MHVIDEYFQNNGYKVMEDPYATHWCIYYSESTKLMFHQPNLPEAGTFTFYDMDARIKIREQYYAAEEERIKAGA